MLRQTMARGERSEASRVLCWLSRSNLTEPLCGNPSVLPLPDPPVSIRSRVGSRRRIHPIAVFASDWEKRIADALWLVFRDHPLPLSLFGDFHQLCVANPLGTDASRRYETGIHYTPAPVVDYLVNAVLDRVFAGRSIDEIKRLRILDPSCGCGAFLIAALRYALRWLDDHAGEANDSRNSWFQQRFDVLGGMPLESTLTSGP